MSLRTRIALIASSAVAVAVLAVALIVYFAARDRLIDEIDESLTDRLTTARAFGGIVESFSTPRGRRGPFQDPRGFDVLYVQLIDREGNRFVPIGQEVWLPPPSDGTTRSEGEASFTEASVDDLHLRIANVELGDAVGTLQIARSLEEVDATLASLALTLTLIGSLGIAGAAALGLFVARSSLRPIGELTEAAEQVAATKELAHRINVDRDDELGRLAAAFNEMLAELQSSKDQQRRLVRDAGHELRTPLTALRTNIELLAKAERMPEGERTAMYRDLVTELAELSDLVNEVVAVAADDDASESAQPVDLGELAEEVVLRFRRRISQELALDVLSPATVVARRNALERAVGNLVDNAAKWSPPDSTVTVAVHAGRVMVGDAGPGIPEDERELIFERFHRAAAGRSQPGSGLGLSIVKQVAESHGGQVFVDTAAAGGALVGFELPVAAADPSAGV